MLIWEIGEFGPMVLDINPAYQNRLCVVNPEAQDKYQNGPSLFFSPLPFNMIPLNTKIE